ncbi:universal stress protein [Streptomyces sp. NPDC096193]|uniref:universal stress protein n=1 Tax=Streptomyces sp. NPDC096193 TaxID=3155821 RepID=UPI00332D2B10
MDDQRMTGAVVVGVVDAEQQRLVVRRAAEEAIRRGTDLRILHAVEWPLPPGSTESAGKAATNVEHAERVIAPFAEAINHQFPELEVVPDLVSGSPAPALIDRSSEASVIVVGHRGTGGFPRLPLGSVSLQVATHSACPVLVVRPTKSAEPQENRVVVGVDVEDIPSGLMKFALDAAESRHAALEVVYANTRPELLAAGPTGPLLATHEAASSSAHEALEKVLSAYRPHHPSLNIRARVERRRPAHCLVDASRHASLLIVGSHGRTGLKRLLLGSVSGEVLHTATCPVMVVPTPQQGSARLSSNH